MDRERFLAEQPSDPDARSADSASLWQSTPDSEAVVCVSEVDDGLKSRDLIILDELRHLRVRVLGHRSSFQLHQEAALVPHSLL